MPEFFPNPERHPKVIAMARKRADEAIQQAAEMALPTHAHKPKGTKRDPLESAYVLPGNNILNHNY
jgi:hypothetical protein